ncbi:MAG TPA: DUF2917 domain-containing protein [Usitatibacter sp.]|nr:DUF2917 domain-containing protein [Usitatibacter sp.]
MPKLDALEIALGAGELLRLDGPRGYEVQCESGQLWITEEAHPEDVWLAPGSAYASSVAAWRWWRRKSRRV